MFKMLVFFTTCSTAKIFSVLSNTDCKKIGIESDFVGKLNLTRSSQQWSDARIETNNEIGFSDHSLDEAENFCRNPTKSVKGCLCYNEDPRITRDLCSINDCDRPSGCTLLVTKYLKGVSTYVLPSWRKNGLEFWLKAWNPDIYEGLILSLTPMNKNREYRLTLGDEDNERIQLSYTDNDSGEIILLKERSLPHLVPSGKWAGYWLRTGNGLVQLGYQGVNTSFFEWVSPKNTTVAFQPVFLNFGTTKNSWIGIGFKCSECLVEETSVNDENKIYPINLWNNSNERTSNLKINLRGTGSAIVTLMWTPDLKRSLSVEIDAYKKNISLLQYLDSKDYRTIAAYNVESAISATDWSDYDLNFTENNLNVYKEGKLLVNWKSPFPLLFYWFSVSAREGSINWSANCPPRDIDGRPRDGSWGDWSPWTCSVTCGKGEGRVERKCDRPPPNVFGEDCKGPAVYVGPCNDFPCGEITPGTQNLIRHHLSTTYKSLEVEAKDRVEIPCNSGLLPLVLKEIGSSNITWTHNGMKSERIKFQVNENFTLVIPRAMEKHNGVYLCSVYQEGSNSISSKTILDVVSLIVKKRKPTRKIRKGNSMMLKCNGWALSQVYADLSQRWELNGTPWIEYGMGVVEMLTTDQLENIDDMHSGIWTCVIIQEDFNFKWTTNWINLRVRTTSSFWNHLLGDVSATSIFVKTGNERNAVMLFICLFVIIAWIILLLICIVVKIVEKC